MKSFGIVKPTGELASQQTFFSNRPDAVDFAVAMYTLVEDRRFGKDGSDLEWKRMKRHGWRIAPVEHVVGS